MNCSILLDGGIGNEHRIKWKEIREFCDMKHDTISDMKDAMLYGIDLGTYIWTEEFVEFSPDGMVDLMTLDHPVFPRTLPTELKGIAV